MNGSSGRGGHRSHRSRQFVDGAACPSSVCLDGESFASPVLEAANELSHVAVSVADLARRVSLSASSTADRLRRLVDAGVITGYAAVLAPEALGYSITAFVRLRYPLGNYKPLHDLLGTTPEIIEAHHVTGDDCFIMKVLARSMTDLERLAGKIAGLGSITTSVVYSSPLPRRALVPSS